MITLQKIFKIYNKLKFNLINSLSKYVISKEGLI